MRKNLIREEDTSGSASGALRCRRYRAYRRGLRLVKYKRNSPGYNKYGPYALLDQRTNALAAAKLDAEAVERELFAPADEGHPDQVK